MRIGSLFSGIGGLELGLEWAGVGHVVWQVERDPFARSVLARHWPDADRSVEDVTIAGAANLAPVDLICGGFPCQDISTAGKGAGLAGERSGLWFEYLRIVRELRPRFVVVENVAALLGRGLDTVLGGLAEAGYDAEWFCLRASDVGAPHRRERLFVVAHRVGDGRFQCELEPDAGNVGGGLRAPRETGATQAVRFAGCCDAERIGADGNAQPLAHPVRLAAERWRGAGDVACATAQVEADGERRRASRDAAVDCREAVADADEHGCESERRGRLLDGERQALGCDADGCSGENVGHTAVKLGRRSAGSAGSAGDARGAGCGARAIDMRRPEPRMGGAPHGLPRRVDRWPAGPGEPQHEWEAPRVAQGVPNRAARLKALGNAVVPQVAEVVGRVVLEILGRHHVQP